MKLRIFTVVHSHRHGTSHYIFTMNLPEPCPEYPGAWVPDLEYVIDALDIDFEEDKEEWVEIEPQGWVEEIKNIPLHQFAKS